MQNDAEKELVVEFVVESLEGLAQVENQMLAIESAAGNLDTNLVNSVFRTMHSIKGTSGFLGLERIGSLAHGLEEVLDHLRNRAIMPSADLVSSVLRSADYMKNLIDEVDSSNEKDVSQFVSDLQRFLPKEQPSQDSLHAMATPPRPVETPGLTEQVEPRASAESDSVVVSHDESLAEIMQAISAIADETPKTDAPPAEKPSSTSTDTTIRVEVALLDKLMTRVGELVLARNQILQYTNQLEDSGFARTAQRLNLITTELQEGVMKTRMQPIGNVWTKFPRVVRDLASQLGKSVRIEMEGRETELDKTIVEAIKDPLTHIVRNSVDHGIEKSEVRIANGKPAEGLLRLRAYHEGGQVNIVITDDGAGLNLERIRKKAIERGLVTTDAASTMNDWEATQLILLPGFSTAEKVTNISGRGVGMDVVKTNIERIGGTLDLETITGHGMTVKIKIPLTLAIIPALIVSSGGDRYAIPQVGLLELVRLEGKNARTGIEYLHGAPIYRLRGKLLPLVNLAERLGTSVLNTNEDSDALLVDEEAVINIVVLRANEQQFGLIVDHINDTEEIVVKPLSRQLKCAHEYAGATIMGDGKVALILDVIGLATDSGIIGEVHEQNQAQSKISAETQAEPDNRTLLVVDVGDNRRLALPISMVSRIETVPTSSIERADCREVIQYRNDILPIIRLADKIGGRSTCDDDQMDELKIIVYSEDDKSCGIAVHRILDIVQTELSLTTIHENDSRFLGTIVLQDKVTDVVNLRELAKS